MWSMHPAASQRHSERPSLGLCPSCSPLLLPPALTLPVLLDLSLGHAPSFSLAPHHVSLFHLGLLRPFDTTSPSPLRSPRARSPLSFGVSFFFFLLSVSFYWQQQPPPPTPSRFYTGKSIQPYVRLAGASAVLVHGFRNLLQLDRTSGAIVRRG